MTVHYKSVIAAQFMLRRCRAAIYCRRVTFGGTEYVGYLTRHLCHANNVHALVL